VAPIDVMRAALESHIYGDEWLRAGFLDTRAVRFLERRVFRFRLGRRQFSQRLHLPDAARLELGQAGVAVSQVQLRDTVAA